MSEKIPKIDTKYIVMDDEAMVSIQDLSADNFNLQNFIDDLAVDRVADEEADGKIIMLNQRLKNKES